MRSRYTVDYFIKKFEAIPDANWIVDTYYDWKTEACCVLGHCGVRLIGQTLKKSEEADVLWKIFRDVGLHPTNVNDCYGQIVKDGVIINVPPRVIFNTPKARILAALEYIKAL